MMMVNAIDERGRDVLFFSQRGTDFAGCRQDALQPFVVVAAADLLCGHSSVFFASPGADARCTCGVNRTRHCPKLKP